jgi:hypothetical protein
MYPSWQTPLAPAVGESAKQQAGAGKPAQLMSGRSQKATTSGMLWRTERPTREWAAQWPRACCLIAMASTAIVHKEATRIKYVLNFYFNIVNCQWRIDFP